MSLRGGRGSGALLLASWLVLGLLRASAADALLSYSLLRIRDNSWEFVGLLTNSYEFQRSQLNFANSYEFLIILIDL